jgi:hypothetical protein
MARHFLKALEFSLSGAFFSAFDRCETLVITPGKTKFFKPKSRFILKATPSVRRKFLVYENTFANYRELVAKRVLNAPAEIPFPNAPICSFRVGFVAKLMITIDRSGVPRRLLQGSITISSIPSRLILAFSGPCAENRTSVGPPVPFTITPR